MVERRDFEAEARAAVASEVAAAEHILRERGLALGRLELPAGATRSTAPTIPSCGSTFTEMGICATPWRRSFGDTANRPLRSASSPNGFALN
jgi:hypothetical protein